MPKIVAQCRKRVIPYLYTLRRAIAYAYTLQNANAYLNTCNPYLNTCVTYLNTLTRRSALGSISSYIEPTRLVSPARSTRKPSVLGSQSESTITSPESSANQNRVLRHPSRQPIRSEHYVTRVEYYVTRELSAPGNPFLAIGSSRLAIAYLNTWGPWTPPTWSANTLTTKLRDVKSNALHVFPHLKYY